MVKKLEYSNQFKKDFKKILKKPIPDVIEVGHVISILLHDEKLEVKYRDHELSANWFGYRECHVKPDLLLIYKSNTDVLKLARIGSHSDLFK